MLNTYMDAYYRKGPLQYHRWYFHWALDSPDSCSIGSHGVCFVHWTWHDLLRCNLEMIFWEGYSNWAICRDGILVFLYIGFWQIFCKKKIKYQSHCQAQCHTWAIHLLALTYLENKSPGVALCLSVIIGIRQNHRFEITITTIGIGVGWN